MKILNDLLRPVFDLPTGEDAGASGYAGSVTAGNAPGINDGAAALVLIVVALIPIASHELSVRSAESGPDTAADALDGQTTGQPDGDDGSADLDRRVDSLSVGETEDPNISRMTIVVKGDDRILEQVVKQLNRLPNLVRLKMAHQMPTDTISLN